MGVAHDPVRKTHREGVSYNVLLTGAITRAACLWHIRDRNANIGTPANCHPPIARLMPSPIIRRQVISAGLFSILNRFVKSKRLGTALYSPCDVVLSDYDVTQFRQY